MASLRIRWAVGGLLVATAGCGGPSGTTRLEPLPKAAFTELAAPSATPTSGRAAAGAIAVPSAQLVVRLSPLHLPTPTTRSVAFPSASSLIIAGGLTPHGTTNRVVRLPIDGRPAATIGRLDHPVHDAAGVTLGGAMLVLGGGAITQDAWVQRVVVDGGTSTVPGHLPAARADLAAVVVGSQAVVVGGGAGGRADPRVLATSDGVHFRLVARLPVAVRYAAVTVADGKVFVIGGSTSNGDVSTIQEVNVAAGSARVVGRLPASVSHATAMTLGGSIVVAGGRRAGRALDTVLTIDPTSLAARTVGRLPFALSDAAGVVVDGVGYLVGGEAARPLATIETIAAS